MTTVTDSNLKDTSDESQPPAEKPRRSVSNLAVRIITGLVLLPAVIFVTFAGGWWLTITALALTVIGTIEFYHMEQQRGLPGNTLLGLVTAIVVVLSFHLQIRELWMLALAFVTITSLVLELFRSHDVNRSLLRTFTTLGGILYIAFPTGFFIAIRSSHPDGLQWLWTLLFATWGTDSFAYLAGRAFGKTPLAPQLSPKKTVEGAIGGVIAGIFFASLVLIQAMLFNLSSFILLVIAPFTAIAGDLFESAIKRYFGVKDSGVVGLNPFPGHGGVLDRIDAMLLVTILFYGYLLLNGLVWL
ncbi:MAG: phosphatidate cytidylyltransferase [Anaerolineae bacterium]|nr:phosphatidate cytidylyltransferase [Anaerolineae bacterium]